MRCTCAAWAAPPRPSVGAGVVRVAAPCRRPYALGSVRPPRGLSPRHSRGCQLERQAVRTRVACVPLSSSRGLPAPHGHRAPCSVLALPSVLASLCPSPPPHTHTYKPMHIYTHLHPHTHTHCFAALPPCRRPAADRAAQAGLRLPEWGRVRPLTNHHNHLRLHP